MTSYRQIEANRRNAIRSTGPITEAGKRRSRQNAVRHGLAAETVIEPLEDIEDYRGFEAAVIASYDARNAVERELVLRLASLLWRLRRATAIETDLLRIQAEISRELKFRQDTAWPRDIPRFGSVGESSGDRVDHDEAGGCNAFQEMWDESDARTQPARSRGIAHCFLRLINIDSGVFERLGRYESALSRQMFRILLLLQSARAR